MVETGRFQYEKPLRGGISPEIVDTYYDRNRRVSVVNCFKSGDFRLSSTTRRKMPGFFSNIIGVVS